MVEGSGLLQWISVYALALTPEFDVVLLDEPDAHLHPMLQQQLVTRLRRIAEDKKKQILLATHSTELIRSYDYEKILALKEQRGKYLGTDRDKVGLLAGIGAIHTPTLHALMRQKRMLIVEAESDERFLRLLSETAELPWPKNLVVWHWTGKATERRQLFIQLRKDIHELKAISIRDRDDEPDSTVESNLLDKSLSNNNADGFMALKWRRRNIENYLLCASAIARAADVPDDVITNFLSEKHALALPQFTIASDIVFTIRDARGKEIMTEGENSVKRAFRISREEIGRKMNINEVAEDLLTFFTYLKELCET